MSEGQLTPKPPDALRHLLWLRLNWKSYWKYILAAVVLAVAGWSFKSIIWPWLSSISNAESALGEPGVFVSRDVAAGQQLTRELVEVRGDVLSVTDDRPVTVEDVVGLQAIQDLSSGTRLTLDNIGFTSSE